MSHEDIRRSLEVLDNVLAEFDDCVPQWETSDFPRPRQSTQEGVEEIHSRHESRSCEDTFSDASSGINFCQEDADHATEELPPPIPKRSPTTRLSNGMLSYFTFPIGDVVPDSNQQLLSASEQRLITNLSRLEIGSADIPNKQNKARVLTPLNNCLSMTSNMVPSTLPPKNPNLKDVPSTSPPPKPVRTSFQRAQKNNNSDCMLSSKNFKNDVINGISSLLPSSGISEDLLNEKFKRVRELLKLNIIKPLEVDPPSFIPSLPTVNKEGNDIGKSSYYTEQKVSIPSKTSVSVNDKSDDSVFVPIDKETIPDDCPVDTTQSLSEKPVSEKFSNLSTENVPIHILPGDETDVSRKSPSLNSNRSSVCLRASPTVEDIPYLLPTDVLLRPQLGLSYSLEDDMSPGVKEICKTSTPKSDVLSSSLFSMKESGLSTFNSSTSSLGYVSSQSEVDLNNCVEIADKVPLTSFKSVTLPHGLDRFPFYSSQDSSFDLKRNKSEMQDGLTHYQDERQSEKKAKKKDSSFSFSRFSRKEKKKNGAALS